MDQRQTPWQSAYDSSDQYPLSYLQTPSFDRGPILDYDWIKNASTAALDPPHDAQLGQALLGTTHRAAPLLRQPVPGRLRHRWGQFGVHIIYALVSAGLIATATAVAVFESGQYAGIGGGSWTRRLVLAVGTAFGTITNIATRRAYLDLKQQMRRGEAIERFSFSCTVGRGGWFTGLLIWVLNLFVSAAIPVAIGQAYGLDGTSEFLVLGVFATFFAGSCGLLAAIISALALGSARQSPSKLTGMSIPEAIWCGEDAIDRGPGLLRGTSSRKGIFPVMAREMRMTALTGLLSILSTTGLCFGLVALGNASRTFRPSMWIQDVYIALIHISGTINLSAFMMIVLQLPVLLGMMIAEGYCERITMRADYERLWLRSLVKINGDTAVSGIRTLSWRHGAWAVNVGFSLAAYMFGNALVPYPDSFYPQFRYHHTFFFASVGIQVVTIAGSLSYVWYVARRPNTGQRCWGTFDCWQATQLLPGECHLEFHEPSAGYTGHIAFASGPGRADQWPEDSKPYS